MKKAIIILFLLGLAHSGYSQEAKKHKFTHSLTENVGVIYKFDLDNNDFHPSIYDLYSLRNLIPSYELGYNNMFFLKLKYRNLRSHTDKYLGSSVEYRQNIYGLFFSYNIYSSLAKHSLKFGMGWGIRAYLEKRIDYNGFVPIGNPYYENEIVYNNLLFSISCSYDITKKFAIVLDLDSYNLIQNIEASLGLRYSL